jgi:hypothetical protein
VAATALFIGAIFVGRDLALDSLLVPMLASIPGLIASVTLVAMLLRRRLPAAPWPSREEATQFAMLGAGIGAIPLAGFFPSVGVYLVAMLWSRSNLKLLIVPYVAAILAAAYGLSRMFNIPLP